MQNLVFLLILLSFYSCNPTSQLSEEKDEHSKLGVRVIIGEKYKPGDNVVFILENNSDSIRYLLEPSRLQIQRKIDTLWYDVRIQNCACGAPCAPPHYVPLEPFQQMDIAWNQIESWCEGGDIPGNDKSAYVKRGTYRFIITVNDSPEREQADDEWIYAEFKIL